MNDQELAKQLMATFLEELHDHTTSIGHQLLEMEKGLTPDQLDKSWAIVFRGAHTMKGASAVVNVESIRDACHTMEDIFGGYRDAGRRMPQSLTSLILKVVDAIDEVGNRLRNEADLSDAPLVKLIPRLQQVAKDQSVATDDAAPEQDVIEQDATAQDGPDQDAADQDAAAAESDNQRAADSDNSVAPPPLTEPLRSTFLGELDDHVQTITNKALALEASKDAGQRQELLDVLFRAVHSLKGAAAAVQIGSIQKVCHHLEDDLTTIRDQHEKPSAKMISQILEAADFIGDAGKRLKRNEDLADAPIQRLAAKTRRAEKSATASADQVKSAPAPPATMDDAKNTANQPDQTPSEPVPKPPATVKVVSKSAAKRSDRSAKSPTADSAAPCEPSPAKPPAADKAASLRVSAQKLDALLAHSGELLVARGRFAFRAKDLLHARESAAEMRKSWRQSRSTLRHLVSEAGEGKLRAHHLQRATAALDQMGQRISRLSDQLNALSIDLEADNRLLGQTCSLLDDEVYNVRMLPFSDACGALARAVRDIASASGKQVSLQIVGADVEVDRSVLEGLKDPLLHLVRNAVDHGVEPVDQRIAAGKSAEAVITVSAALRGGQVEVRVEDDGNGLDLERIVAIAHKREIDVPEDPREQARLIFASGFSTAKLITDVSGRGVGLDVVKSQAESLHGMVDVNYEVGRGTTFTLVVPLTLTTIRAILVVASGQTYAIPTTSVESLLRFDVSEIRTLAGRDSLSLRGAPVALVPLAKTLGLKGGSRLSAASGKGIAVVVRASDQRVALSVDEIVAEQEVLVKNLGARVRRLRHFSGCTLLPTGTIALVVSAANVVRSALGLTTTRSGSGTATTRKLRRKNLLLVDDSLTTRMLLKNILETAGYDVVVAVDGQQAWEIAAEQTFDIVVTDLDMPRVDGFELTQKLRNSQPTAEIPIVLVTARGSDQDKERGVRAGANAYIVKGSFDQQHLLDTVSQLV